VQSQLYWRRLDIRRTVAVVIGPCGRYDWVSEHGHKALDYTYTPPSGTMHKPWVQILAVQANRGRMAKSEDWLAFAFR